MPLSETVLILMALLATGIIASGLFRKLPVPYTVILVLIGMTLSQLTNFWQPLEPLQYFELTPELVLFVFLPALIFESGLNLNARQLTKDIAPVLMLAVPALLFSSAAIGLGLWLILPMDLIVALLFGALISATDPVAVIALFKELGTPERLTVLVEGESLLNDATAIVLVSILLGLTAAIEGFGLKNAVHAVGEFLFVFFGGALVGALFGVFISWLMTRFEKETSAVLILSLVLAYLSFIVAEYSLHVSGVMAVVASAIMFGIFGVARLSRETVEILHETWAFIAHICNTLLFLFVGLFVDLASLISDFWIILFAVLLVQVSRASMVYSLVPFAEYTFKLPHVTLHERHIMFWGGLKGGLAIAIVLSLPADLAGREQLIHLTLGVVLFTLLVNATTIRPLIRKFGIDKFSDADNAELNRGITLAIHGVEAILNRFRDADLLSKADHHIVKKKASELLQEWMPETVADDEFRFQRLNALREELVELEDLFKSGVLSQYTYLDLRSEIQRRRDHILKEYRLAKGEPKVEKANFLLNVENTILKYLREKDWAVDFMPYYQNRRMSNHLMRNIALILMSEAALSSLRNEKRINHAHRKILVNLYKERLDRSKRSIANFRSSFSEFLERYESRLSSRIALVAAMREVENAHYDGVITNKVYAWLEKHIQEAIKNIPPITEPTPVLQARDLIDMIPLFTGLPNGVLEQISKCARPVNYLAGDKVIGSGEHGDALYIISRGRVTVIAKNEAQDKQIAELGAGEFFGEMALLGDSIRKADVKASSACTLLRLNRSDILQVAKKHSVISDRLNEATTIRSGNFSKDFSP